jgi:hypothetical protein
MQIVPVILYKLMSDPSRAERVTRAFLQMKKFEIETLMKAWTETTPSASPKEYNPDPNPSPKE